MEKIVNRASEWRADISKAYSGKECIAALEEVLQSGNKMFDIIFMDIDMPDM